MHTNTETASPFVVSSKSRNEDFQLLFFEGGCSSRDHPLKSIPMLLIICDLLDAETIGRKKSCKAK